MRLIVAPFQIYNEGEEMLGPVPVPRIALGQKCFVGVPVGQCFSFASPSDCRPVPVRRYCALASGV